MAASAARARAYYRGTVAAQYDAKRQRQEKWRCENDAVADLLEGAAGRVLDIPVGTGRFLSLYRGVGLAVIGMDANRDMLAQARKKDRRSDLRLGDIFAIDLPDKAVETAVCVRLLNLMGEAEMQMALRELQRVASKRIVLSMRTGVVAKHKPGARGQTQRHAAFLDALDGWRVDTSRRILKNNYRIYRLVPCEG
jgi:ubiquinone/menaquinone biosynthesis C-methylase UbiE